jgi:hypothetical protein
MEFLRIIFSTFTKKNSRLESDELITWLLQQLDKLLTDSLTAGIGKPVGKPGLILYQCIHPLFTFDSVFARSKIQFV